MAALSTLGLGLLLGAAGGVASSRLGRRRNTGATETPAPAATATTPAPPPSATQTISGAIAAGRQRRRNRGAGGTTSRPQVERPQAVLGTPRLERPSLLGY